MQSFSITSNAGLFVDHHPRSTLFSTSFLCGNNRGSSGTEEEEASLPKCQLDTSILSLEDLVELYLDPDENVTGDCAGWPIGQWNVSEIENFHGLFATSTFNEDITDWDVSSATDLSYMFFRNSAFDQEIGDWTVSKVVDMECMFCDATSFNGDITEWDVSSLGIALSMFDGAEVFNQDIGGWNVSSLSNQRAMFNDASAFDQNLCAWADRLLEFDALNMFRDTSCPERDDPTASNSSFCQACN